MIATALPHPIFIDLLHQRVVFIGLALGGWVLYLGRRAWEQEDLLGHWGFRRQGLGAAFAATSVFALIALVAMGAIAMARQTLVLRWQMLSLLVLYHGWLGVFYYYWVLGRDPWTETFLGQV